MNTRIVYKETVARQSRSRSESNGQKIPESTNVCPFSNLAIAPADSRQRVMIVDKTAIPFLVDAMKSCLHKRGLPVPKNVMSPFNMENYLREIITDVVDKPLSESEVTITSVINIADRLGININLNSIFSQRKS